MQTMRYVSWEVLEIAKYAWVVSSPGPYCEMTDRQLFREVFPCQA
jgi:hypothetical protein